MDKDSKKAKRSLKGTVVSSKMDKTAVVSIESVKVHPKYHKRYVVSRKYKAHDEKNECKEGDQVVIAECRPMSRGKRWRVIKKL